MKGLSMTMRPLSWRQHLTAPVVALSLAWLPTMGYGQEDTSSGEFQPIDKPESGFIGTPGNPRTEDNPISPEELAKAIDSRTNDEESIIIEFKAADGNFIRLNCCIKFGLFFCPWNVGGAAAGTSN